MRPNSDWEDIMRAHIIVGTALSVLVLAGASRAAEIKVMNSGGFTAAYKELAPDCERASGNKVDTAWGASMARSLLAARPRSVSNS